MAELNCPDLCASCSSPLKTFTNLQVVRDERHLAPIWMPPGGCTCQSTAVDHACPRCFPERLDCQRCGDLRQHSVLPSAKGEAL